MSEMDLIERLADEVAKRVKPPLPLSVQLWTIDMIGAYLQRSPRVVGERIVSLPDFPKAIRLPAATAGNAGGEGKSNPLWEAADVIAWARTHKEKAMGRPRQTD